MTPAQFLAQVKKQPAPVYLFLGPETHQRDACRSALIGRVLPTAEEREEGYVRHDLEDSTLAEVLDDARSASLFAPSRVIWVARAEGVLPKGRAAAAVDDDAADAPKSKASEAAALLERFVKSPPPDVTIVFDSARFDFEGEDKVKSDRVRKFYASVREVVEFPRLAVGEVRRLAQDLAREHGLKISPNLLGELVDATGGSAARVAAELEKLRLYAGPGGVVDADAVATLVAQGQTGTVFNLVAAMGRNDRVKALELIDVLVREGEYLPLALQFLASQFRQALTAKENNLRNSMQVVGYFQKQGVAMWPSRAEQVLQTVSAMPEAKIRMAIRKLAEADLALRGIKPDERIVMEELVLTLTR